MSEILETVMLVCFGLSWPINLMKNYRARTAKSMSLGFIVLIAAGYAAGIAAKVATGRINYVIVAYAANLAMVLTNLAVYYVNRGYDRARERQGASL